MAKEKTQKREKVSEDEYEKKVLEMANQGVTSEKIGEKLRREGIHPKEYKKKISVILKEKKLYTNPDLKNIEKKLEAIKKHREKNKQDKRAMREMERISSKLMRTKKYLKIGVN